MQAALFAGPVVVDLDDPSRQPEEQVALRAPNIRQVVVTTSSTARYVSKSNPNVPVTVIPQGVDLDRASRARHNDVRAAILSDRGLPDDTVIIGYHAPIICLAEDDPVSSPNLSTFYVDVLVSAIKRLWSERLPFVAILVGDASEKIVQLSESEPRLILAGYVDRDRLFDWVGAFDIGAYPRTVGFSGRQSVKLFEYMANGAAIVAMRTDETIFLEQSSVGEVATNVDDFCSRLRNLIMSPERRNDLVQQELSFIHDYDWQKLARTYDALLAASALPK
jgi:glycosyltransferase involved in cell wall biosynthesis